MNALLVLSMTIAFALLAAPTPSQAYVPNYDDSGSVEHQNIPEHDYSVEHDNTHQHDNSLETNQLPSGCPLDCHRKLKSIMNEYRMRMKTKCIW